MNTLKHFFFLLALGLTMTLGAQAEPVIPHNDNGWLHYDNGTIYSVLKTESWGVVFQAGTFHEPLSKVKVFTAAFYSNPLTMFIYAGTNTPNKNWVEKYSQVIVPQDKATWQEIELETPISFAEEESCWIILSCPNNTLSGAHITENNEFVGVNWQLFSDGSWKSVDNRAFMIRGLFGTETGVEESVETQKSIVTTCKRLHNGHILLVRPNGNTYNLQGQNVR